MHNQVWPNAVRLELDRLVRLKLEKRLDNSWLYWAQFEFTRLIIGNSSNLICSARVQLNYEYKVDIHFENVCKHKFNIKEH